MAGIYIHIPFCKQACSYCDFHFSTSLKNKSELLKAIGKEAIMRAGYLEQEKVQSIYFGGGTPSLLDIKELSQMLETLYDNYSISKDVEISFEVNPDDLSISKLKELKSIGINRLSIGIQSFFQEDLNWMNRAHDEKAAHAAIKQSKEAGFENISIDLIYGSPTTTDKMWRKNLEYFFQYDLSHLSSYCLTVEPKTKLSHEINKGIFKNPDDDTANRQYQVLQEEIILKGYEQYEVSNFCKPAQYSRHNTAYWKNIKYLGLGPSAHSFNTKSRQWNIANNTLYIRSIKEGKLNCEIENLSNTDRFNEYLMTMLRTKWGIDMSYVKSQFGNEVFSLFSRSITKEAIKRHCSISEDALVILPESLIYSDGIIRDLFIA